MHVILQVSGCKYYTKASIPYTYYMHIISKIGYKFCTSIRLLYAYYMHVILQVSGCKYHTKFASLTAALRETKVWDLEDLDQLSAKMGACKFYGTR
jgi:hypothetical protein